MTTPNPSTVDELKGLLIRYSQAYNTAFNEVDPHNIEKHESFFEAAKLVGKRSKEIEAEVLAEAHSYLTHKIIEELAIIQDKLYDDTSVNWGDPTEGSKAQWGDNHADLWVPTRNVHKLLQDRIKELEEGAK